MSLNFILFEFYLASLFEIELKRFRTRSQELAMGGAVSETGNSIK